MDSREIKMFFKEKYASSSQEIYYVKPSDQSNIAILKNDKRSNVLGIFTKVLLPKGYPNSVSNDYIAYQMWDTAQAFCSTIMGILATQAVLKGVGVGDQTATPLAATITWVLKDGCGHLGRILFAYSHGSSLDSYSKKWRLFADALNDAAMCIEIALPLFHNYTTFALCGSTIMKSIVGVAGGATRVAMTQHHAIRGNMGDVSAKDSAQETAVNLVASITALIIITVMGNFLCSITFVVMMILHIVFNYFAVRAVCLRTLNEPRFLQVIDSYLRNEVIATPCEINRSEPIIFYQIGSNLLDRKMCGFEIKLGQSLAHIIQYSPEATYLKKIKEIYKENQYLVLPNSKRTMYVFLKDGASVDDVLRAYFHAVLLATIAHAIISKSGSGLYYYVGVQAKEQRPFAQICRTLQQAEIAMPNGSSLLKPPFELLSYVCHVTAQEWPNVRMGLLRTGWDLSRHLIMVDEWRLTEELESATIHSKNTLTSQENRSLQNFATPISASTDPTVITKSVSNTFTSEPNSTDTKYYDLLPAETFEESKSWSSDEN